MGYRSKKEVLAGIRTRVRNRDGANAVVYDAYLGYDPYTGKQRRMQSADLNDLKTQIERFYIEYRTGGDAAARLKAHEATDAREALDLLAAHKATVSLTEAVRFYLEGRTRTDGACKISLRDALEKFCEAQVGKSNGYLRAIKCGAGGFIKRFGDDRPVSDITAGYVTEDLKRNFLDKNNPKTWKTYNNYLGVIKTFFGWCAKAEQGYIEKSPVADTEKITLAWKEPEYMSVEDVKKLFAVIAKESADRREDLADAILSFFCGMRNAEIERVREGKESVNVDVANGFIRVVKCKGSTLGKRPRAFNIPEPALTWMRAFDFARAVMKPNAGFRLHLREYAKKAGVKMPANAGRHTFITMHAAAYHDQNLLSSIVGNTENVRANSYDGIEVEANGRAYFQITPQSLGVSL